MKNPSSSENYDQYINVPGYESVNTGNWWAPNPTRVNYVTIQNRGSSQMTITLNPGESKSVYTISEVYDCTTKKTETPYIRNSNYNTSYGYKASVKGNIEIITDTKTFLVKT